ncbi:site-specific integrase [Campylobacter sp. RM16188]|uniref:tyrosine-type recombinase/integrase n=1 Tax=Campylobacter sp. RM16188 TaxID=1705725 RepID=UPI00155610B4|nr:site-specific integrase [Campylobacter sp. RM16188]
MATLGTEKEIKALIAPDSGKATYSIKGQKGLKLYHYSTGGKIFKLRYMDQKGNHTTKTIGDWQEKVYGIAEAIKDSLPYLKELSEHNTLKPNKINNFSELWSLYKEDALKTQTFKSLPSELSRFEYNLFDLIKNVSIEEMNSSRVATPIFLNALKSLQTIGNPKSDTVKKLLNRLNQVFDFAVINGHIENNPTRILSRNFEKNFIKVAPVPRKAITDIDKFKTLISSINEYWGDVNVLSCMKWTMLYALRPSNARLARWEDINIDKKEWIIRAEDMKMKEEFIIPLTDTAIELLKTIPSYTIKQGYLFRGAKHNAPISDNSMRMGLKRLGYDGEMDMHGFRSSFRTIISELNYTEKLGFTEEVMSLCIDHRFRKTIKSDESYHRAKFESGKREIFEYWHEKLREFGLKI